MTDHATLRRMCAAQAEQHAAMRADVAAGRALMKARDRWAS